MDEFAELVTLLRPSEAFDTCWDACSFAFEAVSAAVEAYRGFDECRSDLDCLKRRALETGDSVADMLVASDRHNIRVAGAELPPLRYEVLKVRNKQKALCARPRNRNSGTECQLLGRSGLRESSFSR